MEWKSTYAVNVRTIDLQHQKLFIMINDLHDAMKSGTGFKVVPFILNQLVAYTCEHFADEERLMLRASYPVYSSHKSRHEKFIAEVVKMSRELEDGTAPLSSQLAEFLRDWLQNHILVEDMKYAADMHAAGFR
jgi:hemerythrin